MSSELWTEELTGPGGRLVVTQIHPDAPIRHLDDNGNKVDFLETLYRPDGTTVQYVGTEGADYQALPELLGKQ